MSLMSWLFGKGKDRRTEAASGVEGERPFMEFPSEDYDSSMDAMTSAFGRLREGGYGDRWITFGGQGKGHDADSDQVEEVKVRGVTLDLSGETVDVDALLQISGLQGQVEVQRDSAGRVTLPDATPEQMARFLDAVFRKHFGIHPHDDEDDYAVGAEW
jgi:hypothetical protein